MDDSVGGKIGMNKDVVLFMSEEDSKALVERNRNNNWPDLAPAQRAFAYHYIVHYNHLQAAEECGMSRSSGLGMLRHPLVAAFIEHLQKEQATNSFITKEFITTQYLNMIPMLMGEEEVAIVLANGEQAYGKQFRPAELRGVLSELSKTVKDFDVSNLTPGKSGITVNIDLGSLIGGKEVKAEVIEDGEIIEND